MRDSSRHSKKHDAPQVACSNDGSVLLFISWIDEISGLWHSRPPAPACLLGDDSGHFAAHPDDKQSSPCFETSLTVAFEIATLTKEKETNPTDTIAPSPKMLPLHVTAKRILERFCADLSGTTRAHRSADLAYIHLSSGPLPTRALGSQLHDLLALGPGPKSYRHIPPRATGAHRLE